MAYVVEKAGRHYAVIYEGTNPITGGERRRWHRCPTQADAEALARRISTQRTYLREAGSLPTLGDYLLRQWLPAREAALTATTFARYVTSINHYLVPHLGRVQLRQLRSDQLTALYRRLAASGGHNGRPLAAKTILNLHQILRLALNDAVEQELVPHNPADDIRPPDPRRRPSPRRRATSWTVRELGLFLESTRTESRPSRPAVFAFVIGLWRMRLGPSGLATVWRWATPLGPGRQRGRRCPRWRWSGWSSGDPRGRGADCRRRS